MERIENYESETFVVDSETISDAGGGVKRAEYARKHRIYAGIGKNVSIQSRVVPVYSELIRFHDNIAVARNVDFCTHDVIHKVLNRMGIESFCEGLAFSGDDIRENRLKERIGCIEIMDNVFIGSNSVILYDTKIGPNVVIASGSVVTKDCEPNSVYAGIPARKIGTLDEFIRKRIRMERSGKIATTLHNQGLTEAEAENAWRLFESVR